MTADGILERIEKLKEMCDVQCTDGTWNHDAYLHGMANGIIFALSVLTDDDDPDFLTLTGIYLNDYKMVDKFNNSCIIVNKSRDDNETD